LNEASVRIRGADSDGIFDWANSLATEDIELVDTDIEKLRAIPVIRLGAGPRVRRRLRQVLPSSLTSLYLTETDGWPTAKEAKAVEGIRHRARSAALEAGLPASLEYLLFPIENRAVGLRSGGWLVNIHRGHVRRPGKVVRVARLPDADVIWYSVVKSPSRPPIGALRAIVPDLQPGFDFKKLTDVATIDRVLNLFR